MQTVKVKIAYTQSHSKEIDMPVTAINDRRELLRIAEEAIPQNDTEIVYIMADDGSEYYWEA